MNTSKVDINMNCDEIIEIFNQKNSKKAPQKGKSHAKTGRIASEVQFSEAEEEELIKRLSRLSTFNLHEFLRH